MGGTVRLPMLDRKPRNLSRGLSGEKEFVVWGRVFPLCIKKKGLQVQGWSRMALRPHEWSE